MNIGITGTFKPGNSLWKNGLVQNVLMLYDVMLRIKNVNRVSILNFHNESLNKDVDTWINDYDIITVPHTTEQYIIDTYDLIIVLGASPFNSFLKQFRNAGNKVVLYKGGNTLINQIETIMYGQFKGWPNVPLKYGGITHEVDEIWMVPQQEFHNKDFYEIIYGVESRVVPFVWSPKFIIEGAEQMILSNNGNPYFDEKDFEKWRILSLEPNMSVLKNMMPIIYSMEYAFKKMENDQKNQFHKLIITNAAGHRTNENLVPVVKDLNIFKEHKIAFDGRYPTPFLLSKYGEMVLSHQWGNALNYAYLDVSYFGIPLIHNAHLCKDLGYYYEDWNLKNAGDLVINVMKERKSDKDYTERQRRIIERYTVNNENMIEEYSKLIQNLWDKKITHKTSYNYEKNSTL